MGTSPRDVTDAELAVLQMLWDNGNSTIRQLAEALYPNGSDARHATVQKLLERLEEKDYVQRDRSGHAHVFSAVVGRSTLVDRRLRAMAQELCGGEMGSLLSHLVKAETLSDDERQELRNLIDELDQGPESDA